MLVRVEDLKIGDEILVGFQGSFQYFKVLRQPAIGKRVHWNTKVPMHSNVKVSTRQDIISTTRTRWDGTSYTVNKKHWVVEQDVTKHNLNLSKNLNYKEMWLVKREEINEFL